jgi:hypothetical protein
LAINTFENMATSFMALFYCQAELQGRSFA